MNELLYMFFKTTHIILLNIFVFIFSTNIALTEENIKASQQFKSIKSNNANMRVGPGDRFEILWNFKKKRMSSFLKNISIKIPKIKNSMARPLR